MGLGSYPSTTLKAARMIASDKRKLLSEGLDPLETRNAERAQQAADQSQQLKLVTFSDIAADYIQSHSPGWKNFKHGQQWKNTLATYAEPIIGNLPANEITTDHILKVLKPIWASKTETASRVRTRIELVLDAAKARELREGENPARWRGHLDKLLPSTSKTKRTQNHPALPYTQIQAFVQALDEVDGQSAAALKMTIMTACRTSEVLNADWREIDLIEKVWTIPAIRMKAGRPHAVPLPDPVVTLLKSLPILSNSTLVFPGARSGRPISNMALLMTLRRMDAKNLKDGGKGWRGNDGRVATTHGFRSTFRDWAAECTHHAREVCELSLAHVVASGSEAAYWRSDLLEKRRNLMTDWVNFIISTH